MTDTTRTPDAAAHSRPASAWMTEAGSFRLQQHAPVAAPAVSGPRTIRVELTRHQVIYGLEIKRPRKPEVGAAIKSRGALDWESEKSIRAGFDKDRQREIGDLQWKLTYGGLDEDQAKAARARISVLAG